MSQTIGNNGRTNLPSGEFVGKIFILNFHTAKLCYRFSNKTHIEINFQNFRFKTKFVFHKFSLYNSLKVTLVNPIRNNFIPDRSLHPSNSMYKCVLSVRFVEVRQIL